MPSRFAVHTMLKFSYTRVVRGRSKQQTNKQSTKSELGAPIAGAAHPYVKHRPCSCTDLDLTKLHAQRHGMKIHKGGGIT